MSVRECKIPLWPQVYFHRGDQTASYHTVKWAYKLIRFRFSAIFRVVQLPESGLKYLVLANKESSRQKDPVV